MTQPSLPQLLVTADLRIEIDGGHAAVSGTGNQLRVTTDHPTRLLRDVAPLIRMTGRSTARSGLARLAAQGLSITVAGPKRDLLLIGASAGRHHVKLVPPPAWQAVIPTSALILAVVIRLRRRPARLTRERNRS